MDTAGGEKRPTQITDAHAIAESLAAQGYGLWQVAPEDIKGAAFTLDGVDYSVHKNGHVISPEIFQRAAAGYSASTMENKEALAKRGVYQTFGLAGDAEARPVVGALLALRNYSHSEDFEAYREALRPIWVEDIERPLPEGFTYIESNGG